jgi:hypothetical protein
LSAIFIILVGGVLTHHNDVVQTGRVNFLSSTGRVTCTYDLDFLCYTLSQSVLES